MGQVAEEYKKKIIKMLEEMNDEEFLFKIYHYTRPKYEKETKKAGC